MPSAALRCLRPAPIAFPPPRADRPFRQRPGPPWPGPPPPPARQPWGVILRGPRAVSLPSRGPNGSDSSFCLREVLRRLGGRGAGAWAGRWSARGGRLAAGWSDMAFLAVIFLPFARTSRPRRRPGRATRPRADATSFVRARCAMPRGRSCCLLVYRPEPHGSAGAAGGLTASPTRVGTGRPVWSRGPVSSRRPDSSRYPVSPSRPSTGAPTPCGSPRSYSVRRL